MTMDLPVADQARELARRVEPKYTNKAYTVILNSVVRTVTKAIRNKMHSAVVNIPGFVFGCPRYDIADAVQYVTLVLEGKGYEVTSWPSGSMAIIWSHDVEAAAAAKIDDPKRKRFHINL
jgi:hypothetical protein